MLAPLDNGTIFKKAFTDKTVFTRFVKDIVGIDIVVDKIETEKKFDPKVGNIDFSLDIFAESVDHRVVIEIQRIDYDYNFDRFLHYFMMAIAQLQKNAGSYKINQTVYSIVVLTAPYKWDTKTSKPLKEEVLITSVDPRNLQDDVVPVYGHKLIFLNHHFRNENTPPNYRDWLDLFYESIHNPKQYTLNLENEGIRKAVDLIDMDQLDAETTHLMKINEQKKVVASMLREEGRKEGREEGLEEGLEKGFQEGEKSGILKSAKEFKQNGVPIDIIAKSTGLPKEVIEAL